MNEHNRAVLRRLQSSLRACSTDAAPSVEDLQHRVAEAAQLLERGAGGVAQALHDADREFELLLFAVPSHQQRPRLEKLVRGLQTEIAAALDH
jgi:shikimate 5-dehydrogenase